MTIIAIVCFAVFICSGNGYYDVILQVTNSSGSEAVVIKFFRNRIRQFALPSLESSYTPIPRNETDYNYISVCVLGCVDAQSQTYACTLLG